MGYLHIENLYKNQDVLIFKEVYALEKIHGTSAHVTWKDGQITFHAGGESHDNFVKLFDVEALKPGFETLGHPEVTVYGEAYGGKQQAQSWRYGKVLKFVAFDVRIGEHWLDVPNADQVCTRMGLEFVHWKRVPAEVPALDAERDAPSEQARRNGIVGDQPREGVVLRPLREFCDNGGHRIISKHKRAEERETKTDRKVDDPAKLAVLTEAKSIADEWVTPTRLDHVLDKLPGAGMQDMLKVIAAMIEDVTREGKGEIVDNDEALKAISRATAVMFKKRVISALDDGKRDP